jgi:ABC-type uncharacterized transport system permease subunit
VVVSTDTVDLVRFFFFFFFFFFFSSTVWVAEMEAAAREADTLPAVCRIRRGAATLDGALHDVAGALLSLPTIESETYSSKGGAGAPIHP